MSKPADTYRNQNACVNCRFSVRDNDWADLHCTLWPRPHPLGQVRVEEHGTCDLWEGEE
jgi:hypothetical protein